MSEGFTVHKNDDEATYNREMARAEAIKRAAEVGETAPYRTPEVTDLSGGEVANGRTPASR